MVPIPHRVHLFLTRIYEQVKCLTAPGAHALWFMYEPILMSKVSFAKLNEAQKKAVMAAGQVAEDWFATKAAGLDKTMTDTFKKPELKLSPCLKSRQLHGKKSLAKLHMQLLPRR